MRISIHYFILYFLLICCLFLLIAALSMQVLYSPRPPTACSTACKQLPRPPTHTPSCSNNITNTSNSSISSSNTNSNNIINITTHRATVLVQWVYTTLATPRCWTMATARPRVATAAMATAVVAPCPPFSALRRPAVVRAMATAWPMALAVGPNGLDTHR